MAILLSLIGLLIIVVAKRVVWEVDRGRALWCSLLEVPVDINLVGLLLGLAAVGQLQQPSELTPVVLSISFLLIFIGVTLWKYSCSLISERDGEPYISNVGLIKFCTSANVIVSVISILMPVMWLGAKT